MAEEAPRQPKFRYQDLPELGETFADSVGPWFFDGHTLRIEFTVSRFDDAKRDADPTGRKIPVCRMVLTPPAANELLRLFRQLAATLEKVAAAKQAQGKEPAQAS